MFAFYTFSFKTGHCLCFVHTNQRRQTNFVSNLTYQCIQTTINTNESHPCDHGVIKQRGTSLDFKRCLLEYLIFLFVVESDFFPQTFQYWSQGSPVSPKNNNNKIYVTVWWGNTSLCLKAVGYHFKKLTKAKVTNIQWL